MTRKAWASLFVLAALGCAHRQAGPTTTSSAEAPLQIQLPRFPGGELHSLAADRGNVVLLDVWATWCEPCKDALPVYQQLAERLGPRGFRAYAITVDEDPNQVKQFIDETHLTLPVLYDKDATISEQVLKVSQMPTTFLLDRRGIVRHVHEGLSEGSLKKVEDELNELLSESP